MGSKEQGDPKKAKSAMNSLIDLDDPAEFGDVEIEQAPDTARPDYEPIEFAQHVESAEDRMTQPPSPTYDMLRDSCKAMVADEVPLDEEQIVRPASRKYKLPPA